MFTTIAELERNAYCRFYKTKRCIAYTLGKQIFEKYSLLYKAGKAMLLSEAVVCRCFPKEVSKKISPISQKSTCAGVSFHCEIGDIFKNIADIFSFSYRTPPVVASDLSLVRIPKFEGQLQLCLLLLATLRILFEETITRTISSVIARSTNKAF